MYVDELRDYYAQRLPEYDRIYDKPERQADLALLRDWVWKELRGLRVLELACGTGYWTSIISETAESVLATDAVPEVLDAARQRNHVRRDRISFQLMDAYHLEAMPGRFNAVFAGFWLSHVRRRDLPGSLRSLQSCVEPGFRIVMIDNRYVPDSSTPLAETDAEGNTYQVRRLDDGSQFKIVKNFWAAEELRDAFGPIAINLEIRELTYYWFLICSTQAQLQTIQT